MSATYKILVGEAINSEGRKVPMLEMLINEAQYQIILTFADQEKDELLGTTFILNKCRFHIVPVMNLPKPTTEA
jgi:predicted phage tail protein